MCMYDSKQTIKNNYKIKTKNNIMYKTKNILKFAVSMLFVMATFTACVKDDGFDTPQITCDDSNLNSIPVNQILSMNTVTGFYTGTIYQFSTSEAPEDAIYMVGYVVSDDAKGNYYKELYIQDKRENPTSALKLNIDQRSLYTKYPFGTKIIVKLNGLAIDLNRGELVIGEMVNGQFNDIREKVAQEKIMRYCETGTITPIEINSANEINNSLVQKYVVFNGAQFDISVLGLTIVDPNDSYDSHRPIVFCLDDSEIKLETSTFASFGELPLPTKKFNISGIISRNYTNAYFVLKINSLESIETTDDPRCDPLFKDGFSNGFTNWTTYSVLGSEVWQIDPTYGNPGSCAKMTGYAGSPNANEDWLITPSIDLSNTVSPALSFQTAMNYSGPALEVFISTDYVDGDNPTSGASWTPLTATLSSGGWSWTDSGNIDLSNYVNETIHVAFKYTSTSSATATYEVDNVLVKEQ